MDNSSVETKRAAWRLKPWCVEAGVGRSTAYKQIKIGRVKARKCGSATLIETSPREWLENLPAKPE